MEKYEKLKKIGSGSYGYVYKCRNKQSGDVVAIKKFLETEDDPTIKKITFREIRVLRDLNHPNIVNLVEVFRKRRKLHLVFEFCSSNLLDLMTRHPDGIPDLVARDIVHQILQALHYMHANLYVHRDVKPENILLHAKTVKLCDFGFARPINKPDATEFERKNLPAAYTDYVATRWYRAPELLVGEPLYGPPVDIWATGCVYAETMTGEPLWPGTTDLDQLFLIRKTLGEIPLRYVGFFNKNPFFNGTTLGPIGDSEPLESKVGTKITGAALDLLTKMLTRDAVKRPTAEDLMQLPYFDGMQYTVPLDEIKKSKQKQMMAVFKAFAEREVKDFLEGPELPFLEDGNVNSTSDEEEKQGQEKRQSHEKQTAMRKRVLQVLQTVASQEETPKHSLMGPRLPAVRDLLKLRKKTADEFALKMSVPPAALPPGHRVSE